jgi:hypothetical protein
MTLHKKDEKIIEKIFLQKVQAQPNLRREVSCGQLVLSRSLKVTAEIGTS